MMSLQYAVFYYYKDVKRKRLIGPDGKTSPENGKDNEVLARHKLRVKLTPRKKQDQDKNKILREQYQDKNKFLRDDENVNDYGACDIDGLNDIAIDVPSPNSHLQNLPRHREVLAKQNRANQNKDQSNPNLIEEVALLRQMVRNNEKRPPSHDATADAVLNNATNINEDISQICHGGRLLSRQCLSTSFYNEVIQSKKFIFKLVIVVIVICGVICLMSVLEGFYYLGSGCIDSIAPQSRTATQAIMDGWQIPESFRIYDDPAPARFSILSALGYY